MNSDRAEEPRPAPPAPRPSDAEPRTIPIRYGSGMVRRFGWFYRFLALPRALGRLRFEEHSSERIREAARKGPIVYVMLHASTIDHLALNTVLNRRRLPLSVWSNVGYSFFWQPVTEAWRDAFHRLRAWWTRGRAPAPVTSGWLASEIASGSPATIFLDTRGRRGTEDDAVDPIAATIEAQALTERDIQLVPVLVVWDRSPENTHSNVVRWMLGSRERPGMATRLRNLYFRPGSHPFVQAGEPVDLRTFLDRASPERRRTSLRILLRRYLRRESGVIRGPRLLPRSVLKHIVLDNPVMRRFAAEHAEETSRPVDAVLKDIDREFDQIAANFNWWIVRVLRWLTSPLWTRVYRGYDIREEDLEKVRQALRGGSAVLVPCHKSHFDYLLMSTMLFHADLVIPHIVAGNNLAFWPFSILARACGAFFIKRSFAGEPIHATVFARYVRELLRQGYPMEFFIEGGRTRTGKLLPGRPGVLEMVLDAASYSVAGHEITLLPVSIAYEQVAEARVYRSEMGGKEKVQESMWEILKARSVLRRRYGRIHVRVGEPVTASSIIDGEVPWRQRTDDERRDTTLHAVSHVVHEIGQAMLVLPTGLIALALLAHPRQGIVDVELLERAQRWRVFLTRRGAQESDLLQQDSAAALDQAIARFVRLGWVRALEHGPDRIIAVVPEHRVTIDFHKNQLLHFFSAAALTAAVIRPYGDAVFDADTLLPAFDELSQFLRREFVHDPRVTSRQRLDTALQDLVAHGALGHEDSKLRVRDPARLDEVYALVESLLEAYLVALRYLQRLGERSMKRKELEKDIVGAAEALVANGDVARPEGLTTVTVANALRHLTDIGVVTRQDDQLQPNLDAVGPWIEHLEPMVDA